MVRMCEKVSVLPDPGSLLEQDSYLIYLFQQVFDADAEKQSNEEKKMRAEQEANKAKTGSSSRRRRR